MKWLLIMGAVVGGSAAAAWHHRDQLAASLESFKPQAGSVKPVVHSPSAEETIYATGFVEGAERTAELRFELMGRLEKIFVTEGQPVRKGEVLAQLDSAMLKQQVVQAQADLTLAQAEWARLNHAARSETRQVAQTQVLIAQAELAHLEDESKRTKRLYDKGVASEQEWMDAFHPHQIAKARLLEKQALAAEVEAPARNDDLAVAQSRIDVAQAALTHAKLRLEKTKLLAPSAGTILHLAAEKGELVGPSDREPVLLFANLAQIRVRAYVEELNALKISVGDSVQVSADGLPNQKFKGTVVFMASWMDEKQHRTHKPNELLDVKTREILVELKNAENLVVGLPVEVEISPAKPAELSIRPQKSQEDSSPSPGNASQSKGSQNDAKNKPGELPDQQANPHLLQIRKRADDPPAEPMIGLGANENEYPYARR